MKIKELIKFYRNPSAAGRAVGVSRQRVAEVEKMNGRVPLEWQIKCEADSAGHLKADVCKKCGQALPL